MCVCDLFCMRIDTGDLGLQSHPKEFVESAQNLTPEKSKDKAGM